MVRHREVQTLKICSEDQPLKTLHLVVMPEGTSGDLVMTIVGEAVMKNVLVTAAERIKTQVGKEEQRRKTPSTNFEGDQANR